MPKYDQDIGVIEREPVVRRKVSRAVKKPNMYKVILLNDDYTPMDFVVHILMSIFNKSEAEAVTLMMEVHNKGLAVVGVYTFEVAETKVWLVSDAAHKNEHPLKATMEIE